MNYVYGRSMVVMDSENDRMRLKDKIVANVAKAVKSIQELQMLSGSKTVILGNYDWQCHRLCEHLDHTLLHGLRHVTPGYWKVVSEFTHKDCTKEIKRMRNVTTDLGRGRAWLFMALNECLLESYLRCYQQNDNLVGDFYVRDALVRDQDKFDILLTIISGLENMEFHLECDMPYLDLCVYPPKSKPMANVESTVDFDSLSVCSMESLHIPSKPLPQAVFETNDIIKPQDLDCNSIGANNRRHSPSLDSGIHSDWNYRQRSITPIDHMSVSSSSQDLDSQGGDLEVVHLGKKGKPHKHKKRKKKFVSVASISEPEAFIDEHDANRVGPVIEIPPLDDIKLFSAILNSQNNNDSEFDKNSDHLVISRTRSPGDGMEISEDKLDGTVPSVKDTTSDNIETHETHTTNANEDKNESHSVLNSEKETISVNQYDKEVKTNTDYINGSGTFTDMIKARVSNIVSAGELIESDEQANDKTITTMEETRKSKTSIFDYSFEADKSDKNLEDILNDEPTTNEAVIDTTNNSSRGTRPVSEVPSIYSTHSSYISSDEEDTEYFGQDLSQDQTNSARSTPSLKSNTSAHSAVSKLPDLVDNLEKNAVSSRKGLTGDGRKLVSPYSDSSANTPEYFLSNQNRSRSVMSNSSANETEDEISTNQKSLNSRPGSRLSANEGTLYRNSPALSSDTHSSTHSPSTDLEASGKVLEAKVEELIVQKKLNEYTHLTFGEEDGDDSNEDELQSPLRDRSTSLCAGEVMFDNNTMLYLMLDILKEDDSVVKMFCCQQGHTEGKTKTILFLISAASIYFLQPEKGKKKFQTLAVIPFADIDFVSIGFNNQVLNIACKSRRQKYWITTGEETITIAVVDCLADSMEKCDTKPGQLEVDTSNTLQKISLQKYIQAECRCEPNEADVICYSLVHWEDPGSDKGSCEWDREGSLYFKSNETANILGTQTWRLAYAALRDNMLCLYHDKQDSKPVHFLSVGAGQCVGCKRDFNCDKNHAVQIMLSDGSYWTISLESEDEANKWLQGLCQAVAEGLKMKPTRPSCVPCCMVLSKHKILMCHEDLETNFIRTLGSANLQDITSVFFDELNKSYLVLVFESEEENVSSEKWVLYFNSDHECTRFQTSLSHCWYTHFQVEVPVLPIDDFSLQKICTEMVQHLRSVQTIN